MRITKDKLAHIVKESETKTVIVFGDLYLDRYIAGEMTGIAREAPAPRIDLQTDTYSPGGGDQANPQRRGSSEIALGRLKSAKKGFLATIEPWHGNNVAVYMLGSQMRTPWQRRVIDTTFNEGHALASGDLDDDGDDEIIAGYRRKGYSLYVYNCLDRAGTKWERIPLDEGDMAASGLHIADINNDGRLDILCVGTATSNIKWYENLGPNSTAD